MCAGVLIGLDMIKLSGSPKVYGKKRTKVANEEIRIRKPTMSFTVKYQWKGILSAEDETPNGLFLPVLCSSRICITTVAAAIMGVTK